ncbi:glycosyltransferase family 4 protein [Telluribacter humicola]|uniref:glycosyltransferase family 4 protein n=1 Tax=Telluribacter humicola TaxID=1720261 RepID=UPI001A970ACA|nr:glycosyltransferase family 4 protein [Telluribacter humicola]
MKVIVAHPTANSNVRASIKGFAEKNILQNFYTSIAVFEGSTLESFSKIKYFNELKRREFDNSLKPYVKQRPWTELGRQLSKKFNFPSLTLHEQGKFCTDAVYRDMDSYLSNELNKVNVEDTRAVYLYEDGALSTFLRSKDIGLKCIFDAPLGYWRSARRLLASEVTNRPEWVSTLTGFKDSTAKLKRKDLELSLADHIIVASSFTKETLKEFPGQLSPISVIPYGFPPINKSKIYKNLINRPLNILFVGGLSQRKGIANLFEAVGYFGDKVNLTVVGGKPVNDCNALNDALSKHKWIPSIAHHEVLDLMREHDVFIFPSLFEGFGLVITESMSQGTPVITTERTAGPDIINNNESGWIVEAGSTTSLITAIDEILSNPNILKRVGMAAMEKAYSRPWHMYGDELADKVFELIKD